MAVEPVAHGAEGGMFEPAFEKPPQTRYMAQIVGLAVAQAEPGEDADDLGVALRPSTA